MMVPLSIKRSYRYTDSADRGELENLLTAWPPIRAGGKLPFVVRYGMIARAPRVAATLAVFVIVGALATPRGVFDYRTAAAVLPVLWLLGVVVFGGLQGLQLWRWQERLYRYTVAARVRETESRLVDVAVEPPTPWRITFQQTTPLGQEELDEPSPGQRAT